jgi:hypothetical protein
MSWTRNVRPCVFVLERRHKRAVGCQKDLHEQSSPTYVAFSIFIIRKFSGRNRVFSCLENEISVLSSLSHSHIVRYHGCAKTADCICICMCSSNSVLIISWFSVMEYMTGGTIKEQVITCFLYFKIFYDLDQRHGSNF